MLENIFGDNAKGILSLHELKAAWGASKEVGEARALGRSNEFSVVLRARDFGREAGHGRVAEGAVEMEMEFYFAEIGHGRETIYLEI